MKKKVQATQEVPVVEDQNKKEELVKEDMVMGENELCSVLLELSGTRYWMAIEQYLKARERIAESILRSVDPFKNPTELARTQGTIEGLKDLVRMIEILKERAKKEEEKANL